jgi:hypothetical protein
VRHAANTAFAGGRAPRAWQRGIARAVAPLGALRRSAAWLAGLARVRLGLRDEPLLGRCFQEIASQPFPTAGPGQPEVQPRPTRPRLSDPPARLTRASATEPGSNRARRQPVPPPIPRREETRRGEREEGSVHHPRDRRDAAEPLTLGIRAERELIQRWADRSGALAAAQGREGAPVSADAAKRGRDGEGVFGGVGGLRPSPPAPLPAARPDPRERGEHGRVAVFPSVSTPSLFSDETGGGSFERRQSPLSRWSGRAAGRGAGGEGRRPMTPPFEAPEAPGGAASLPRAPIDLPAPWRLSVTGETAPGELLERWRTPGLDAPVRSARPSSSPGAPSRNLQAPPRDEAPPPVRAQQPEIPETAHQETTLLPPPPSLPPFLRTNGAGDGLARHPMTAAVEAKTILAPPAGPAVPPAEDLDALAAKIQRILDDEARRHGISV